MRARAARLVVGLCLLLGAFPAGAAETVEVSKGARLLTSIPLKWKGDFTPWSAAAKGDLLFLSSPNSARAFSGNESLEPGGFITYRLTDRAPYAKQISKFACPSTREGDISVWRDYILQGADPVDPLNQLALETKGCGGTKLLSTGGLRIVDIKDPSNPKQVGFAELVCGAKNHTVIPSGSSAYVYTLKDACHQTATSIDPGSVKLRVLKLQETPQGLKVAPSAQVRLSPHIECYDWALHLDQKLAACYGRSRMTLLDIADPPNPEVLGTFAVLGRNVQSATFTGDGRYLAAATIETDPELCTGTDDDRGVVLIYDVEQMNAQGSGEDPVTQLEPVGRYSIPRTSQVTDRGGAAACGSSTVTLLPTKDPHRYIAAAGWNTAGATVFDFTEPSQPNEIGYMVTRFGSVEAPGDAHSFSSIRRPIWHQGRLYAAENMDRLGLRILEVDALKDIPMNTSGAPYNPQTVGR